MTIRCYALRMGESSPPSITSRHGDDLHYGTRFDLQQRVYIDLVIQQVIAGNVGIDRQSEA